MHWQRDTDPSLSSFLSRLSCRAITTANATDVYLPFRKERENSRYQWLITHKHYMDTSSFTSRKGSFRVSARKYVSVNVPHAMDFLTKLLRDTICRVRVKISLWDDIPVCLEGTDWQTRMMNVLRVLLCHTTSCTYSKCVRNVFRHGHLLQTNSRKLVLFYCLCHYVLSYRMVSAKKRYQWRI